MFDMTESELSSLIKERTAELFKEAGKPAHLAKMIGVPPQLAQGWLRKGRISKRGAELIAANDRLGDRFTAEYLRPDITL